MQHTSYSIRKIQELLGAGGSLTDDRSFVHNLAVDSRKLRNVQHTLFFALQGRRDGHDFIDDAYQGGVRNFVVLQLPAELSRYYNANFLIVSDTLKALQTIAAYHRRQFNYPVVAITGSNGKTIVKEWLYQLLAADKNIIRSPKSYNSQLGVPLSVWAMGEENNLAIFEAGISRKGEMEALQNVIQPTVGILTNIGEAHSGGFLSRDEKITEKLLLFKDTDLFVYSPKYLRGYEGPLPGKKQFTWDWDSKADLQLIDDEILENGFLFIRGVYHGQDVQCAVPFTDAASVENAVCCWATILALGCLPNDADKRLEKLQPVKMRLELKTGTNNCSIIDDSYSLDISSLAIALDFLKQQNQHAKRTLILSDLPGVVNNADAVYRQVAQLLENKEVNHLIGVGSEIESHAECFKLTKTFFQTTDDFLNSVNDLQFSNETILLKGARSFEFERISKVLTQKVHETVLEINLNALENNLNYYKSLLERSVKLMAMVKAFSYGSGSFEIANLLQFNKVDYLAVAYADEGITLRKAGISLPIMVMNPDILAFDVMIEHDLEPEIFSFRVLRDFVRTLKSKNRKAYPVHLKLDTGMHRLGFGRHDMEQLLSELSNNDALEVKSVFSHLVASEDPLSDEFTKQQIHQFSNATELIKHSLGYEFIRHLANTSGISRHPDAQFDMVRLGIGLYGIDSAFTVEPSPLETVTALKTSISQIKDLQPGDTVGYNRKGIMPRGGRVATVKIGYADGYSRKLGNGKGKMLLNGKVVRTIGNICMDMCMLDITGVNAVEGDEVIVFNDIIRVTDLAREMETIPYEVLTSISERVKRVYFYE